MTTQEAIDIIAKYEQPLYKNINVYDEYYELCAWSTESYRDQLKQTALDIIKKIRKEKLNKICQKSTS
jgi:hypothetical protein